VSSSKKKVKVTFFLDEGTNKLLDAVAYLTSEKKVHILNEATREYLSKIIESKNLKDKIDVILSS